MAAIRAFQGERARRALLYAVRSDPSPDVRAAALTAVAGMIDSEELFLVARRAVADPHRNVRRVAVTLFTRIPPGEALPALMRILPTDDEDPVLLETVAHHAEAAFDIFVDLALGLASGMREGLTLIRVARYIHHENLPMLLKPVARSRFAEVREAMALLWCRRPELVDRDALAAYSADPVALVRVAAVQAWARIGEWDRLPRFFDDPDASVRRWAALELRNSRGDASPARGQSDSEESVRAAAWLAQLVRGERIDLPGDVSREAAAAAIREVFDPGSLRATVSTATDAGDRLTAGRGPGADRRSAGPGGRGP